MNRKYVLLVFLVLRVKVKDTECEAGDYGVDGSYPHPLVGVHTHRERVKIINVFF